MPLGAHRPAVGAADAPYDGFKITDVALGTKRFASVRMQPDDLESREALGQLFQVSGAQGAF